MPCDITYSLHGLVKVGILTETMVRASHIWLDFEKKFPLILLVSLYKNSTEGGVSPDSILSQNRVKRENSLKVFAADA